jgi:hypothetical protein
MINGISNSFSATIDGLTSFELSSLSVDEIDAGIINVDTEIFTPIVVLKDGVNTTTMSQSGLQTIIQNDENLGTMTFNTKGPFGANVQSLTLSYLTTTINTNVLQVNGRVQPNTIRFPDGVTVGDKVVYLRGDNIYKDYKVTFRNSPDDTGDLFYNIPVGYAHTFSYGDTSYVNILSIRSNGDILFTDISGNKITYYTGYSTEIATNILRHIVPSSASHRFKVGTTDIMTIDSSGVNVSVTTGNIALKDAANTFTLTNTFPRINFTDALGTKLQYFTGYTTEIQGDILRHNIVSTATHRFAINSSDRLTISNTEINVNASNSTSGLPRLVFWKHPSSSARDSFIVRSGVNLIYSTGEIGSSSYHLFQIGIPAATNVFSIGDVGASLERGNLNMNTGDIRFPATATKKIQYYGAGGPSYVEVVDASGNLRHAAPFEFKWYVGLDSQDILILNANELKCKRNMILEKNLYLYDITTLSFNFSRIYHFNTNLYIHNTKVGGLTFIQASDASGNAVDVFEVGISECRLTAVDGLIVRDGTGVEGSIFCINYGGTAPYIEMRNAMVNGGLGFSTLDASSNVVYPIDISTPTLININGTLKLYKDFYSYAEGTIFMDASDNMVFRNLNNDYVFKSWTGSVEITALSLNSTNATLGSNVNLNQSGTGVIYQGGTSTNILKGTDFTGIVNVLNGNLFRMYNTGSTNFLQIYQYINGSYFDNLTYYGVPGNAGNQTISLRTADASGNMVDNLVIQPLGVTAKQNFTVNGNLSVLGSISGVVSYNNNITLPSTWIAKTPGTQLGGRSSGTQVTASQTFSNNVVYNLVSLALTPGVYMVYGLASYYVQTAGTITQEEITIGEGASGIFQNALTRDFNPNMSVGYPVYPIRSLNTYYEVTASTTLHLNVRLLFSSGTYQRNSTSATNCILDAIRIA